MTSNGTSDGDGRDGGGGGSGSDGDQRRRWRRRHSGGGDGDDGDLVLRTQKHRQRHICQQDASGWGVRRDEGMDGGSSAGSIPGKGAPVSPLEAPALSAGARRGGGRKHQLPGLLTE